MTQEVFVTFVSALSSLSISLLTAVVGLIVTALKYKKQKYEIAMLEESNKLNEAQKNALSSEDIDVLKIIAKSIKKEGD